MSHMLGLAAAARPLRTGRDADAGEAAAARLDGVKLLASLLPPSAATPEGTSLDGDAEDEEEEEEEAEPPAEGKGPRPAWRMASSFWMAVETLPNASSFVASAFTSFVTEGIAWMAGAISRATAL